MRYIYAAPKLAYSFSMILIVCDSLYTDVLHFIPGAGSQRYVPIRKWCRESIRTNTK